MTLRAILFDMDGTLIDSDPIHASVFVEFLAERGVDLDEDAYTARIHGRQNREIFAELLPDHDPREMDAAKEAAFRARVTPELPMIAGARDFVAALAAGPLHLGVVTNACRANLDAVLEALDLGKSFDHRISADDVSHGKPHPELYQKAMAALGVTPDQAIAFEDSPSGVQSARAAGLPVIGITSSLSASELIELGATHTIGDFTDPSLTQHLAIPEGATS